MYCRRRDGLFQPRAYVLAAYGNASSCNGDGGSGICVQSAHADGDPIADAHRHTLYGPGGSGDKSPSSISHPPAIGRRRFDRL
jgi:hypothetical protein